MIIRYSKISFLCAVALFVSLVAFGNITDYGTNFAFVHHVFLMDTIFPTSTIKYRAIESSFVQHVGYIVIIVLEVLTAALCWMGAARMFKSAKASGRQFNRSKNTAVLGLTLGFLVWQVGFTAIGGEWFGMWMSQEWNGVSGSFRLCATIALVLLYLVQKDEDIAV